MLYILILFLAVSRQMLVNLDSAHHFCAALLHNKNMAGLLKNILIKLWCFGYICSIKLNVHDTPVYL